MNWEYKATILNAIDGDTLDVVVDLGFRISHEQRVRLYGVNTPERGQPGYAEAQNMVKSHVGSEVVIRTIKPHDKYGRWLAEVLIDGRSLSDALIASGHGVPYFGGKRATSLS